MLLIAIMGSLASGKTTLMKNLQRVTDWEAVAERPEQNPFLAGFYANPPRWCFHSQSWFLSTTLTNVVAASGVRAPVIMDHSVEEIVDVHSPVFMEQGFLTTTELDTLEGFRASCRLEGPAAYIHLDLPPSEIQKRVVGRGRGYEPVPDEEILEAIRERRISTLEAAAAPVLTVAADNDDVRDEGLVKHLARCLCGVLGAVQLEQSD